MEQLKNKTCYEESMEYIDLAKAMLQNTAIENGKHYTEIKYVKSAAGIAYAGLEQAAKWLIRIRDKKAAGSMEVSEIRKALKVNYGQNVLDNFNDVYQILHINIYYNNDSRVKEMKEGIANAKAVIELLKPYNEVAKYEVGGIVGFHYHLPMIKLPKDFSPAITNKTHNAYAVCTCGELFTYDNTKSDDKLWICPKCKTPKPMKVWID